MAAPEMLARLNVKNCRFDIGSGGIVEVTPELIAGACAGLPKGAWYLGLLKYSGQSAAAADLEIYAWMLAADLATKHNWRIERGKPYLRAIARLACAYVISAHRCLSCRGTGFNRLLKVCRQCSGTTLQPEQSLREMARLAEIPFESFRLTWEPRYRVLLSEVQGWDDRLCKQLSRELRN